MKFTPGPWAVDLENEQVVAPSRIVVYETGGNEYDIRLIAAAPELYELAEMVRFGNTEITKMMEIAANLIYKIEYGRDINE